MGVDVRVAGRGSRKTHRGDVDGRDRILALDEAAHQSAKRCFVIRADDVGRNGRIVGEDDPASVDDEMPVRGERAGGAADRPRQFVAADSTNLIVFDESRCCGDRCRWWS